MSAAARFPLTPIRRATLAAIHIGKTSIGMPDDAYREMLERLTGERSAASVATGQLGAVMDELRAKGAKFSKPFAPRRTAIPADRAKLFSRVEALCKALGKGMDYADGVAKRVCKVDKVEWCTPEQLGKVCGALSHTARRQGVCRD